ncbi:flavin monoamine oxidase family protein [Aliterella atlantica]|uniref:Amine oxidase n=1 Tax=Aliterella atlantica CENA595 TaxID=1618023 RepID=A0A0D8ZPP9_9CYAN|nr:FAD-dependent oxidoreductase [Aliterella atlantica]KJH70322.1 amine oxidase [Aliterella atlantica CENA595]
MSHSPLFGNLARAMRIAQFCDRNNISTSQGMEQIAAVESRIARWRLSRREFLALSAVSTLGAVAGNWDKAIAAPPIKSDVKVGIVGAGLAGLVCGNELKKNGIVATLYDASNRVGGRCFSMGGSFGGPVNFPNQVVERGGEFIDNLHKTMLGLAQQFGLTLEDVEKQPGEVFYYFNGQRYPESVVVDEYRNLVAAMRADLLKLSSAPTADNHTSADVALDNISLLEYLETRQAGSVVKAAISAAYMAEYGLELYEQSCLNFLLFIHADKRSKFKPFGVFSDERYHIVEGNEKIAQGLASQLPGQINLGMRLVKVRKNASSRIELTFANGAKTTSVAYDAVVLAIPFTVLRQVELDTNLELPVWKRQAISQLGYGTNAKMMLGFNRRPWVDLGSNGSSYSNLLNHQSTWESNPTKATSTNAVLTDYSSGKRGALLNPSKVQQEATRFLGDLELVYPGAKAAATRNGDSLRVHLEQWTSKEQTLGSYTCYKPGQFTSIAGNEGKPVGNLHFAGEHANSFYEWQGFMEGAALSGMQAASEILQDLKPQDSNS